MTRSLYLVLAVEHQHKNQTTIDTHYPCHIFCTLRGSTHVDPFPFAVDDHNFISTRTFLFISKKPSQG
jgi:hypothetical protein